MADDIRFEESHGVLPAAALPHAAPTWSVRLGAVLWPAFLMAGVMEMLIFAVVDPNELHWFGQAPIDWPREAIYSVTFFLCWIVTGLSSGLTALLALPADAINRRSLAKHFP